ncbi:outer membrane transport energization protein TonB [Flavobacterium resistens]|uniref:Energy transducer TonB n=1 Tax=Flavobacterium resistens TaxID=443612 RepID=A0A521ERM3_9FLAO|nr:energy transducer TonB [Flavobacterium resistens]MRX67814.1 energy transducer TonB [Flavobacterium resistens]SMO85750.1 outer membrane transport energization protein TonB [Flavobacterium resistens]
MSKSSIYESKWTDLVFENKNKEYGAYQLRQENSKTTVTALFMALLLIAALGSASMLINKLRPHEAVEPITTLPDPIVVKVDPLVKPEKQEPIAPPAQKQEATKPITSEQLTNPVVSRTEEAVQEIATNAENHTVVDNATPGDGTITNVLPGSGSTGGEAISEPPATNEPLLPTALDKMPSFPGGMDKFYSYVGNNFKRPELDAEMTLKVYVSFVIEKDGSITDIMVQKDPGYGMGKEAIRVLKSLKTKWVPGVLNGKAVRTAYNLPITIKTQPE